MGRWVRRPSPHSRSSSWPRESSGRTAQEKWCLRRFFVFRYRSSPLRRFELCKSLRTQLTGRACTAAIAPVMALAAVAQVTAMAVFDQEIKKCLAADFDRQGKCLRLVDPHQRRMNGDTLIEAERERDLHCFNGVVSAVGIARVVSLAHPGDEMAGATPVGQRPREAEEHEVATWHEGCRQSAVG